MPRVDDLQLFSTLATSGSLSAAAREHNLTLAAVSKRLASLEARLGARLVNRTTRRMSLTEEGESYLERGRQILTDLNELEASISAQHELSRGARGLLRVNATFGFGRKFVAPLVSRFAAAHPLVQVQLELTDHYLNLAESGFDVAICVGDLADARLIARRIGLNRRVVCASPGYWKLHPPPKVPADLTRHNCIVLRQFEHAYGTWRFAKAGGRRATAATGFESVKVRGGLASNDGEATVQWAQDGRGVILRSTWEVAQALDSGRLVAALPDYVTPDADIYAVVPQRKHLSARVRLFVDAAAAEIGRAFPLPQQL